ncbi:MAG: DUF2892 domain-containing protein [Salinimicrobium sp.]
MKENVGKKDQLIRSLVGPALLVGGYFLLKGKKGHLSGLSSMIVGALISESAITRVCPVIEFFGIDTREKKKSPIKKIKDKVF